jgi:predicted lipoprotein
MRALELALVGVLFWLVPPFHVVRISAASPQVDAEFDPKAFTEKFWSDRLMKSIDHATDANTLLAAIRKDPNAARSKYGRGGGIGGNRYYFLAGEGRVVSVEPHAIALSLDKPGDRPDIILETGNIFGNAVRDGTELLNVSDFSSSQNFNAISSEINRRIEQTVLPALRAKARVGSSIHFAGCAEIAGEETDSGPLRLIPFSVLVQ